MPVTEIAFVVLPLQAFDPALWPRPCPVIAENVRGVVFEADGCLFVPFLASLRPRRGFVARYLDTLPADKTVIFPEVMSAVLDAALRRRGFREAVGLAAQWGDTTHCLIREAGRSL